MPVISVLNGLPNATTQIANPALRTLLTSMGIRPRDVHMGVTRMGIRPLDVHRGVTSQSIAFTEEGAVFAVLCRAPDAPAAYTMRSIPADQVVSAFGERINNERTTWLTQRLLTTQMAQDLITSLAKDLTTSIRVAYPQAEAVVVKPMVDYVPR